MEISLEVTPPEDQPKDNTQEWPQGPLWVSTGNPQSPLITTPSLKVSSNRFSPFISVSPEYAPLAYIDVEISYSEKDDWIGTWALLDCGGQGNFVNEEFSNYYPL